MGGDEVWFATFAAGFGPLVRRLVERDAPGSRAFALEDNALRFECDGEPSAILAYCRSLFRVLGEAGVEDSPVARSRRAPPIGRDGVEALLGSAAAFFARDRGAMTALRAGSGSRASAPPRGYRGDDRFVLRAFGPDDPASLPEPARRALEATIARSRGGRVDPRGGPGSREYRLQARADGRALFLERRGPLGGPAAGGGAGREEPTRRGELPRTTCRLLAELSGPRPGDVFLDPFCGYGGIALERALAAPYRFVFASDLDPDKVAAVKEALRDRLFERRRRTFFPKVRDALDGSAFEAGFVGAIATDPPWGLYEGGPGVVEAGELVASFAREAARVLGPEGRLVLLVARDRAEGAVDAARRSFELRESLEVLVSGKKASALRFDRKA